MEDKIRELFTDPFEPVIDLNGYDISYRGKLISMLVLLPNDDIAICTGNMYCENKWHELFISKEDRKQIYREVLMQFNNHH